MQETVRVSEAAGCQGSIFALLMWLRLQGEVITAKNLFV